MDYLVHRSPSVGGLIKKILAINPDLGVQEIVDLVRRATKIQGDVENVYASKEVVDENLALELAKQTLK